MLECTEIPIQDAATFFVGFKKIAEEIPAVVEAPVEAAPAGAEPAAVDPATVDPQAAQPGVDIVGLLAQCVAHELKQQVAYVYYAEMMTGLGRGELSRIFKSHAASELSDAKYFLKRLAVLAPGGVPIPPSPMPVPSNDPQAILQILLQGEAHAITLLQTLHQAVATDPMVYAIESMLTEEQDHHDTLSRYIAAPTAKQKIAAAQALVVPPAGEEPTEEYLARDQALSAEQATAESADARARVEELTRALDSKATELSNAQMESEGLQQQMEQQAAVTEQVSAQAQMATEQAVQAQDSATMEADKVMRLSQRIQQFRQQLATLVASDPVGEELGAAAGGAPLTPEQAAAEGVAAEQGAAMEQGGPQAATEVAVAQEAGAKAQGAAAKAQGSINPAPKSDKPKSKTANWRQRFHDFYLNRGKAAGLTSGLGEAAGRHMTRGAIQELSSTVAKHRGKMLGVAALGATVHGLKQHARDKVQKDQLAALQHLALR